MIQNGKTGNILLGIAVFLKWRTMGLWKNQTLSTVSRCKGMSGYYLDNTDALTRYHPDTIHCYVPMRQNLVIWYAHLLWTAEYIKDPKHDLSTQDYRSLLSFLSDLIIYECELMDSSVIFEVEFQNATCWCFDCYCQQNCRTLGGSVEEGTDIICCSKHQ